MSMDLTPVVRAEMMIARLDMKPDSYASFIYNDPASGDIEVLRLEVGSPDVDWDSILVNNLYVSVAFVRLRVIDYEGFENLIDNAEKVEIDGEMYAIQKVDKPFGVVRVWTFKLVEMSDT